jgi:hypothetical protein
MDTMPAQFLAVLAVFAPAFSRPTWDHACTLMTGTLLSSGRRTIASALRAVGRGDERHFTTYHRVLNHAIWSPLRLSRLLLTLLVATFQAKDRPVLLVMDGTLERRWGRKIALKGRFHDAVRSQPGHVVTTEGVHWLSVMLLVTLPWCARPWALPFLTVPTRCPATSLKLGRRHRTMPDYACILVRLLRWWLPDQDLVLIGDSGFAVARLGHLCRRHHVRLVSRLLLNAQLYDPIPPQRPGKPGVKPQKGPRQPKLEARVLDTRTPWHRQDIPWYTGQSRPMDVLSHTALWHRDGEAPLPLRWVLLRDPLEKLSPFALFCTDQPLDQDTIIAWYILRWNIEVTFQELRAHLGVETQRQWSSLAIARTTPCLFGVFSLVVLLAYQLCPRDLPLPRTGWYVKREATFADALAVVRRAFWLNSPTLRDPAATAHSPQASLHSLLDILCYAA